jgi:hypothetical protein
VSHHAEVPTVQTTGMASECTPRLQHPQNGLLIYLGFQACECPKPGVVTAIGCRAPRQCLVVDGRQEGYFCGWVSDQLGFKSCGKAWQHVLKCCCHSRQVSPDISSGWWETGVTFMWLRVGLLCCLCPTVTVTATGCPALQLMQSRRLCG